MVISFINHVFAISLKTYIIHENNTGKPGDDYLYMSNFGVETL
jgi:hypothetical protein